MPLRRIVSCVLAACFGAPIAARATDYTYNPPSVNEYWFSGNFDLDGDVDATGEDLGANAITLTVAGIGGPDTLTWTYKYQLKVDGNGPGFRATSATQCDLDFLTVAASTPPGGATCDIRLWFLTPSGQKASKVWTWTDRTWSGTSLVIEANDILGRLDDLGCIGGFTIEVAMTSGSVSVSQMSLGWEAGSIAPCPAKGDAIFDTGPGQALLFDEDGQGQYTEGWSHWNAGALSDKPQSWQLQAFDLLCHSNIVKSFDLFYEEVPEAEFDTIHYRIWKQSDFSLVRQGSLAKVPGVDDPLTKGTDTLLHNYEIEPLTLARGNYWFTAFAEGEADAYFLWRHNALNGVSLTEADLPFGYHSSFFPAPGFVKFQISPLFLKPLDVQDPNHLYNTAFRLRGVEHPYADCELDGDLDVFDFLCFMNAWAQGKPYADCEKDDDFDSFDFTCFQNLYALRCPPLP